MALTIAEVGRELEEQGLLARVNDKYVQTVNNCVEIASFVASRFGYSCPDRTQLPGIIQYLAITKLWNPEMVQESSPAVLVVRTPVRLTSLADIRKAHVSFKFNGQDYNFGVHEGSGYEVDFTIPLKRAGKD